MSVSSDTNSEIENLRLDVAEINRLAELAQRRRVKDILSIEAKKLETKISFSEKAEPIVQNTVCKNTTAVKRTYDVKLNTYAWDQSDSVVKVFVTLQKVETLPPENIQCNFENTSFELRVHELEGKNYVLSIKKLHSPVKTEKCSWKVKSGMVIVSLVKSTTDRWADLTKTDKKDTKKTPKFDENGDPSAGIMNLMKQMYDEGDDEMKRTISKAWYESREKNMNMEM